MSKKRSSYRYRRITFVNLKICHQTVVDYVYVRPGCLAGVLRSDLAETVSAGATDSIQHQDGHRYHRHADGVDHDSLVVQRRVHIGPVHRMPRVSWFEMYIVI